MSKCVSCQRESATMRVIQLCPGCRADMDTEQRLRLDTLTRAVGSTSAITIKLLRMLETTMMKYQVPDKVSLEAVKAINSVVDLIGTTEKISAELSKASKDGLFSEKSPKMDPGPEIELKGPIVVESTGQGQEPEQKGVKNEEDENPVDSE